METPEEQVKYFYPVIAPLIMCAGIGDGRTTSCVMAQAATINALRKGLTLKSPTDNMECACPLLRYMAIFLNDGDWWESDLERTELLRPLIPLLLDSKGDNYEKRRLHIVDFCYRKLTPLRIELFAEDCSHENWKDIFKTSAERLKETVPVVDEDTEHDLHKLISTLTHEAHLIGLDATTNRNYSNILYQANNYGWADSTYTRPYISRENLFCFRDMFLVLFRELRAIQ